jgi:hypothetical protein
MAAEARAKADRMRTTYARRLMLNEAARYEQQAQQAKFRALPDRVGSVRADD